MSKSHSGTAANNSADLTWAEWRQACVVCLSPVFDLTTAVLSVGFTQFTQGMQLTLPFTIAVYMVRDWEGHISEERVSRLTGLLAAVYSSSSFLTALGWGYLSDHIGRKPVVVFGNVVCALAIVGFGAAPSYGWAVVMRCLPGLLNGITGALKTIIGEKFDGDGQARALSALSCAWGIGTVIGSLLGGSLADPCREVGSGMPLCGPGELLDRQPFLLPCAAVGALSSFAAVVSITVMDETLQKGDVKYSKVTLDEESGQQDDNSHQQAVAVHVQEPADTELVPVCWRNKRRHHDSPRDSPRSIGAAQAAEPPSKSAAPEPVSQAGLLTYAVSVASSRHSSAGPPSPPAVSHGTDSSSPDAQPHHQQSRQTGGGSLPLTDASEAGHEGTPMLSAERETADGTNLQHGPEEQQRQQQWQRQRQQQSIWYRSWEVQFTVLGYGAIALLNTFLNELVPLFASAPRDRGGLALKPRQLAGPLAFSGAVFLVYAAVGYPQFQRRVGILAAILWGLVMLVPSTMLIPLSSLPPTGAVLASQALFYLSLAAKSLAGMNAFTGSIVLVNKSAPAGQLGAVNGAGQMLASAVRGAAPALCGVIWAASLGLRLPGHQFLPFAVVGSLFVGIFFWYFRQRDVITSLLAK